MYTKSRFPFLAVVRFTWRMLPALAVWSAVVVLAHTVGGLDWLRLPALPVGVLGTAVSFYLGFKGSAAYDRMWEARKIWGGIVNTSRTWGTFATTLVTDQHVQKTPAKGLAEVHRALVYRHVAWLAALRLQLRRRKSWEHDLDFNNDYRESFGTLDASDARMRGLITPLLAEAELERVMGRRNRATQILQAQGEHLTDLLYEGRLEDFRHMEMAHLIQEFYTLQGKCERIKNFPLPRQYATANHWFMSVFIFLLPLALVDAFSTATAPPGYIWGAVPVSMLVGWVFYTWDQVLEYTENPFEGLINDIPMDALSRTIEIDLREMLGERDLPPAITATNDVLL